DRKKLDAAGIPSDLKALADVIRDKIIELRASRGRILGLQRDADAAAADADVLSPAPVRATVRLGDAQAKLAAATTKEKTRNGWKAAIAAPPRSGLMGAAAAAQSGPEQTAAKARIDGIPAELQTLAEERIKVV